jgi:hypothetical protein
MDAAGDIRKSNFYHHRIPFDLCAALQHTASVSSTFSSKKIDYCPPSSGHFFWGADA